MFSWNSCRMTVFYSTGKSFFHRKKITKQKEKKGFLKEDFRRRGEAVIFCPPLFDFFLFLYFPLNLPSILYLHLVCFMSHTYSESLLFFFSVCFFSRLILYLTVQTHTLKQRMFCSKNSSLYCNPVL